MTTSTRSPRPRHRGGSRPRRRRPPARRRPRRGRRPSRERSGAPLAPRGRSLRPSASLGRPRSPSVARALIVGCGCRGRELGGLLRDRGVLVRGTSRTPEGVAAIEGAGLEAAEADPERPGTILDLCGDASVVVWLLGSAGGDPAELEAVHGPRLERLVEKLVDSPVRGFGYEAAGSAPPRLLEGGRLIVERAASTWQVPVTLIEGRREDDGWAERAAESVVGLLHGR